MLTLPRPTSRPRRSCRRRPVRRGWEVPDVTPADLQRICSAGWPAREQERLGDWLLRAHGGITGRANSAMAVGDPGTPLDGGAGADDRWYADRGLPPLLQLPLADPANLAMADAGWDRAARDGRAGRADRSRCSLAAPRADLRAVVEPTPSADWLSLMHDLDDDADAHVAILTGPPVVGFATLYDGDRAGRHRPVSASRASGPASPRSTWHPPPAGGASAPR